MRARVTGRKVCSVHQLTLISPHWNGHCLKQLKSKYHSLSLSLCVCPPSPPSLPPSPVCISQRQKPLHTDLGLFQSLTLAQQQSVLADDELLEGGHLLLDHLQLPSQARTRRVLSLQLLRIVVIITTVIITSVIIITLVVITIVIISLVVVTTVIITLVIIALVVITTVIIALVVITTVIITLVIISTVIIALVVISTVVITLVIVALVVINTVIITTVIMITIFLSS